MEQPSIKQLCLQIYNEQFICVILQNKSILYVNDENVFNFKFLSMSTRTNEMHDIISENMFEILDSC